jgi:trehalose 6-phosphate synthase
MNLVAKEFIAARTDLRGVLVLSEFTGAARELTDALLINPYAVDEFASALKSALTMPVEEQERRMRRMRSHVADNNIYRWAGMLLSEAGRFVEVRHGDWFGGGEGPDRFGPPPRNSLGAAG